MICKCCGQEIITKECPLKRQDSEGVWRCIYEEFFLKECPFINVDEDQIYCGAI